MLHTRSSMAPRSSDRARKYRVEHLPVAPWHTRSIGFDDLRIADNARHQTAWGISFVATLLAVIVLYIGVVGGTITLVGVALIIMPGPAFVVLPLGLAILGVEFLWARRLLRKVRDRLSRTGSK